MRLARLLRSQNSGLRGKCLLVLIGTVFVLATGLSGCSSQTKPGGTAAEQPANVAKDPASAMVQDAGSAMHSSLEAAKKTQCQSNLQQLRQAISAAKASDGAAPATLAQLGPQLSAIETCPSTGQPYRYDPTSGQVQCTTPGHEKL